MQSGLDNTDGILCLDFINTVVDPEGSHHHLTQLVLSEKEETERTKKLNNLVKILMTDFSEAKGSPIYLGCDTLELGQHWSVGVDGQYQEYNGKVNIKRNNAKEQSFQVTSK